MYDFACMFDVRMFYVGVCVCASKLTGVVVRKCTSTLCCSAKAISEVTDAKKVRNNISPYLHVRIFLLMRTIYTMRA